MSSHEEEIDVIFKDGAFHLLHNTIIKEGTRGKVIINTERISDVAKRYRKRVDHDVMQEFLDERS